MVTIGPLDKTGPSTRFYGDGWVVATSQGGNYSTVRCMPTCYNGPSGSTGSYYNGWGQHWVGIDGVGVVSNYERNPFLPSGYAQNALRWQISSDVNVGHDGNGYRGNDTIRMHVQYGSINEDHIAYLGYGRIAKVPGKPPRPVFVAAGTTTIDYNFTGPSDNGGSGIDQYEHQSSPDSNFGSSVQTWRDDGSPGQATNLIPGTMHYIRFRAHNGVGWGPYSDALAQTTLPAVPPGFVVASSPSGTSARVTFAPPGGVTGVTKYTWERRLNGTTSPVTSEDITVTIDDVPGLTPGLVYDWRGSAWIGTYQSPWTDWLSLQQAKPDVNPGQYFDGDTPDIADINYGWTGTAHASTSTAVASGVEGWDASFVSGSGVIYRVTAGIFSAYAARVQVVADTTGPGQLHAGQKANAPYATEVTPDATYIGSMHVKPSRGQQLAAVILWYNAAHGFISSIEGASTSVPGGEWFRLAVGAVAPAGAAWAIVRVIDSNGPGFFVWHGGDTMDLDGAMISLNEEFPYFDGNTLSDGQYVYEWEGDSNASVSTRTPVGVAEGGAFMPELGGLFMPAWRALIDPDCTPVPAPPRPPVIPSDCIKDVGVWRRYYTQIPANLVPDWMDVVPTLDIISGASAARQVRIRYYSNPDDLYPEEVDTSSWMAEQIISFMPAKTVMTLDGVTQRVWAEINNSAPVSADHLLYGTNGRPATWPLLSCGISYLVTVDVPSKEPPGNITVEAALTARA